MDTAPLMKLFSFSLPMVMSIIAILLTLVIRGQTKQRAQTSHLVLLICYLAVLTIDHLTAGMGRKYHELFLHLNGILFSITLLQTVFYAHFVFIITRTDGKEHFSPWNYALPAAILAVWIIWSAFIPYDDRLLIIKKLGTGYKAYRIFLNYRTYLLFLAYAGYIAWEAFRIYSYRRNIKKVPYPAERRYPSLNWLLAILILDIISVATNFFVIFAPSGKMVLAMMFIGNVIYIVWLMIVCYNMMVGNYWLVPKIARASQGAMPHIDDDRKKSAPKNTTPSFNVHIDRERFESYIEKEKPYLNPEFKIADLAQGIGSNRTYVSMFIKSTFGTNFSGYLNTLRLEEFDRIAASYNMANTSKADIAAEAGFGTYKSYMRARTQLTGKPESGSV